MLKKETSVKLNIVSGMIIPEIPTPLEKTFQENALFKDLIAVLFDILAILPYEIYNIYYKMNEEAGQLIVGIGGVNDIRDIGDLYLSMKLGIEGDSSRPGACFYRRLDKDHHVIDHTHDISRIRNIFRESGVSDARYKILFDPYLGNLTIIMENTLLK